MFESKLRAIDLYSGVGGWSLGLSLADVDVVASYDRWAPANRTNRLNNGHATHTVDIRALPLESLPQNIDIVVGSPPCTEFSFSNRGGGGDLRDGLKDIIKFLSIVEHVRPRWWVMENVPRVSAIIEKELGKWGRLARFRHLQMKTAVLNLEDFGLPQRRRRCFVGNIDFDLLRSYASGLQSVTLGEVVKSLSRDQVVDPLFGIVLAKRDLRDHDPEPFLDEEERRINEAGKLAHPVYNSMPFPDPLERTVRTITATCTRVSRESVIIEEPGRTGCYRRLTARERACLQGFPITYQFYGDTYGHKLRMIGNAVPPAFAYYVAHAIRQTPPSNLPLISAAAAGLTNPEEQAPVTKPDRAGRHFQANRTFRFSVPNLRLKSGVRFEMANRPHDDVTGWAVDFYFGTSKDICRIDLGEVVLVRLATHLDRGGGAPIKDELARLSAFLNGCDLGRMQAVWSHSGPGGTRPFAVLDELAVAGARITALLEELPKQISDEAVNAALLHQYGQEVTTLPGVAKLVRNSPLIHAGLLVGSTANIAFARQLVRDAPARGRAAH